MWFFPCNIQCPKLSPSNDEMHNEVPVQRCLMMPNEKKVRLSTTTKTLDAYVQSGEEILRGQHVFD